MTSRDNVRAIAEVYLQVMSQSKLSRKELSQILPKNNFIRSLVVNEIRKIVNE